MVKTQYINIHNRSISGDAVKFEVYSEFFDDETDFIIKFHEDTLKLTFEKLSMDYRGKTYKGTRRCNAIKFSYNYGLPLGKFLLDEDESDEDILVFDLK